MEGVEGGCRVGVGWGFGKRGGWYVKGRWVRVQELDTELFGGEERKMKCIAFPSSSLSKLISLFSSPSGKVFFGCSSSHFLRLI